MDVNTYMVDPASGMCIIPRGYVDGQEYEMVLLSDFDRVTAERDALQLRLNAVEEENDRLRSLAKEARNELLTIKAAVGFSAETLRVIGALDIELEKRP